MSEIVLKVSGKQAGGQRHRRAIQAPREDTKKPQLRTAAAGALDNTERTLIGMPWVYQRLLVVAFSFFVFFVG